MLGRRRFLALSILGLATAARAEGEAGGGTAEGDVWAEARAGRVIVLLRHATAPGTGDPPGFRLEECRTQRNLSDEGRAQATRIGALFRGNGMGQAEVFSSQWCRCLDTSRLLDLGPVQPQPLLNSFFGKPEDGRPQTEALRDWMARLPEGRPIVLVTHQVNITGLTGIFPASGEMLFVRRGGEVMGRVRG